MHTTMRAIEISLPVDQKCCAWSNGRHPRLARESFWCAWKRRASTVPTSCSGSANIRRHRAFRICRVSKLRAPYRAVGPDVSRWREGDSVCALVAGGGYAEYCVVPEPQALPLPRGFRPGEAAAIPETFFTVWTNLFDRGRLTEGETRPHPRRLERHRHDGHSAGAGIRRHGLRDGRLGREVCRVRAARRTRHQLSHCRLRSSHSANATGGKGVDVILDIVGGDYLQRNIECLAMHGRLIQIGLLGSSRAEINLRPLMQKRLTLTGSTLRTRSVEEKGAIARELEARVWPLLASRQVAPVIDRTLPLGDAAEAHRLLESGEAIGKIVLVP